jgi:uncharacterized protein
MPQVDNCSRPRRKHILSRGAYNVRMDENSAPPVTVRPVRQRGELLDVLRGVAILGILFVNVPVFSGWAALNPQRRAALPAAFGDIQLDRFLAVLIESKFYSLLSLLFGVGFAVMLERFSGCGANPMPLFLRRYAALFVIGMINAACIFRGDILMLYGLLGYLLLLFRRLDVRALMIWAISLLVAPILLYGVALELLPNGGGHIAPPTAVLNDFAAFKSADYARIISDNIAINDFNWLRRLVLMFYPRIFGMFVLGLALGRMVLFGEDLRFPRLLRAFSLCGVLIGLPASILSVALDRHESFLPLTANGFIRTIFESVGAPLLCLGYIAWITLLFQYPRWHRPLLWLAPVGRTALSNYLLQGIVCVFLFYGVGAGLFMRVSLATCMVIIVCVFAVEVVVSHAWLTRFSYGPVEWIWRQLTYWKRIPMRRDTDPARAAESP